MIYQLKPLEDSFYDLASRKLARLDCIILGEGKGEVKVFKEYLRRINIEIEFELGLTDCEGIDTLYEIAKTISILARIKRKIKVIAMIVDSESFSKEDRVKSVVDSLGKEFKITNVEKICCNTYLTKMSIDRRNVWLVISINGEDSLPFKSKMLEDHGVQILLLENKISIEKLSQYNNSKEIISENHLIDLIRNTKIEYVRKAFCHIGCLIENITSLILKTN